MAHLNRLRHIRDLLAAGRRPNAAHAKLLLVSARGFTQPLQQQAAEDEEIVLVSAGDLYR